MKRLPVGVVLLAALAMFVVFAVPLLGIGDRRTLALLQLLFVFAAGGATAYLVVRTTDRGKRHKASGDLAVARADAVKRSGRMLISRRTGGRLGDLHFSYPLFKVSVYPGGIILNPGGSDDRAIFANEIQSVEAFGGTRFRRLRICHRSPEVHEDLTFNSDWESALATAIRRLVPTGSAAA